MITSVFFLLLFTFENKTTGSQQEQFFFIKKKGCRQGNGTALKRYPDGECILEYGGKTCAANLERQKA